ALLWRIHLEGTPVGERWQPLASAWGRILTPGFYPFNDMHAVMSFIGNGELDRAENLVRALDEVVARPKTGSTGWAMTASILLSVCRSLVQFGRGEYDSVIANLLPIRTRVHRFGGSHAQRDAVERTLLEAAMRAGRLELASALVSERLSLRECNSYAWSKRAWLRDAAGIRPEPRPPWPGRVSLPGRSGQPPPNPPPLPTPPPTPDPDAARPPPAPPPAANKFSCPPSTPPAGLPR